MNKLFGKKRKGIFIIPPSIPTISYLLNEQFTGNGSLITLSSANNPRTCEPGPGAINVAGSPVRITATGRLSFNASYAQNSGVVTSTSSARTIGKALFILIPSRTTVNGGNLRMGWSSSSTINNSFLHGIDYQGQSLIRIKTGTSVIDSVTVNSANLHQLVIVLRNPGAFLFFRDASSGDHRLLWVYSSSSVVPYAQIMAQSGASTVAELDDFQIRQLSGVWTDNYGIATSRKATTVDNDTSVSNSDAMIEHSVVSHTGITQELRVRYLDDNNCILIRMDQTNSTIAVYSVIGGVETLLGTSASQFWIDTVQSRVVVILEGSSIKTVVDNVVKNSVTSTDHLSNTGIKVSHAGSNLIAWPRTYSIS